MMQKPVAKGVRRLLPKRKPLTFSDPASPAERCGNDVMDEVLIAPAQQSRRSGLTTCPAGAATLSFAASPPGGDRPCSEHSDKGAVPDSVSVFPPTDAFLSNILLQHADQHPAAIPYGLGRIRSRAASRRSVFETRRSCD